MSSEVLKTAGARVLVCDDEEGFREVLETALRDEGYQVSVASNGADALRSLRDAGADLIMLDIRMPEKTGIELIPELKRIAPDLAIVMMTAYGTIRMAVDALSLGACDFLTKPFDLDEMKITVRKALELRHLSRENQELRPFLREHDRLFPEMIGTGPGIMKVHDVVLRVARYDITVLVTGESGTGKELVARAVHREIGRADGPFLTVACSGLPDAQFERELFGYENAGEPGMGNGKPGTLELAAGGTLFLDEVGDLSPALQEKLLRVLQDHEFVRAGGSSGIRTDARIVASTNRDLRADVAAGRFREDLFCRLDAVTISIPPLRKRMEDLPLLVARFLREASDRYCKDINVVEPEAYLCLRSYPWPGNVRELRRAIEHAVLTADTGTLACEHLPGEIRAYAPVQEM